MKKRLKIAHVWQGYNERKDHWRDGLWAAYQIIEKHHDVSYIEPDDDLDGYDILMYHEAPCTIQGENQDNYKRVMNHPTRKALLFAGGPLKAEWVAGFDHVFVESQINADEAEAQGIPHSTAFGINTDIFKPLKKKKKYKAIHHGTCASWKRQQLVGEAFGEDGILVGQNQKSDPAPFEQASKLGTIITGEKTHKETAELVNESECLAQTSAFWGGGQRATLEAMACNVPPIVMEDSPKNREYVEESGYGEIAKPEKVSIQSAFLRIKDYEKHSGREYVMSKWTPEHYANNLLKWIEN